MNIKDKEAVNAAKDAAKTTKSNSTTKTGRAKQSAETAGGTLQGKLSQVSDRLAINMKNQIVASAVVKVLEDFENGDFGDLALEMFSGLNEGINAPLETQFQVLEAWEASPKYALPAVSSVSDLIST